MTAKAGCASIANGKTQAGKTTTPRSVKKLFSNCFPSCSRMTPYAHKMASKLTSSYYCQELSTNLPAIMWQCLEVASSVWDDMNTVYSLSQTAEWG